jgi:hypothetical protein
VCVTQDGRLLHRARPRALALLPGRPSFLDARWTRSVDPAGGPVRVSVIRPRFG